MKRLGIVWTLVGACAFVACAPAASSSDAGTDAASQTVGDQCAEEVTELCMQLGRCAVALSTADCIANQTPTCCVGSVCNEVSKSSAAAVDACKASLDAEDCNSLVNGVTPAACQGVPQAP